MSQPTVPKLTASEWRGINSALDEHDALCALNAKLERRVEQLEHDIEAYRGALGYSVPASHNGKLTDGGKPQCGLCNSEYTRAAKEFYDKWLSDSSLETWFPITAEKLKQLRAEATTARVQLKELSKYAQHAPNCHIPYEPCTCGLSKLLEEIKL